jgi:hypothetical protein
LPAITITWSLRLIFAIFSIPSFWPRQSVGAGIRYRKINKKLVASCLR